jgi:thymidine kinase
MRHDGKIPYIEIITGPMFSGKSTTLLEKYHVFTACGYETKLFKLQRDARYDPKQNLTHSKLPFRIEDTIPVEDLNDLESKINTNSPQVILIEEAQFYSPTQQLAEPIEHQVQDKRKIVIATLLNTDFRGQEFNEAGKLLAIADHITTNTARCTHQYKDKTYCHAEATRTQRIIDSQELEVIGGAESYQPRCRKHFKKQ